MIPVTFFIYDRCLILAWDSIEQRGELTNPLLSSDQSAPKAGEFLFPNSMYLEIADRHRVLSSGIHGMRLLIFNLPLVSDIRTLLYIWLAAMVPKLFCTAVTLATLVSRSLCNGNNSPEIGKWSKQKVGNRDVCLLSFCQGARGESEKNIELLRCRRMIPELWCH